MPVFATNRERRLWIATLAVVAAIYATLGLTGALAKILREQGLLAAGFLAGMVFVAATVFANGLRFRLRGVEVGVALGIATAYYMVLLRMAIPTERSHLIEYGIVAVLIDEALLERSRGGHRVPASWLLAIVLTTLIGAIDEAIQYLLPIRVFSWEDILFNFLAAVMAVASCAALRWARRPSAPGDG